MYESSVITVEVEDSRNLTNKLYENWIVKLTTYMRSVNISLTALPLDLLSYIATLNC